MRWLIDDRPTADVAHAGRHMEVNPVLGRHMSTNALVHVLLLHHVLTAPRVRTGSLPAGKKK